MSGFYFGNGNGYSYGVRNPDGKIMEFVSDAEAKEYYEEKEPEKNEYRSRQSF